jgi:hypothetical protein
MAELESEQALPRSEIAAYLREFADELDPARPDFDASREERVHEHRSEDDTGTTSSPDDAVEATDRGGGQAVTIEEEPSEIEANEMKTSGTETTERTIEDSPGFATDDRVTLMVGTRSATVNPPATPTFLIEVDSDSSLVSSGERQRVTFQLEWQVEEVDEDSRIEFK